MLNAFFLSVLISPFQQCSYSPGNRCPFRRCGIRNFFAARGLGTLRTPGRPQGTRHTCFRKCLDCTNLWMLLKLCFLNLRYFLIASLTCWHINNSIIILFSFIQKSETINVNTTISYWHSKQA